VTLLLAVFWILTVDADWVVRLPVRVVSPVTPKVELSVVAPVVLRVP